MNFSDVPPDTTIVPLGRFLKNGAGNPLRMVEAYWSALRKDGTLPRRSQVDPRGLQSVLAHVFILERIAPGLARFRIAGSDITRIAGIEVRGMPISALFHVRDRSMISSAVEQCFDGPAVIESAIRARPLQRGAAVDGRLILLPMLCDAGRTSRALGAFVFEDQARSDAHRFEIDKPKVKPVFDSIPAHPQPVPGMAEERAPFIPARPTLTLVHSVDWDR